MASSDEIKALLAVPCPWCGAKVDEKCRVRIGRKIITVPSTLDGESHDARWRAALARPAAILTHTVARIVNGDDAEPAPTRVRESREPVLLGAVERPW